jgi:SWI/SNF-related matrix-associated actin-dependent regulator 1 of chromatin subfamily A
VPVLRGYQQDAVRVIQDQGRVLLANPPGTGKTGTVLSALKGRALIVAPLAVVDHWVREADRFGKIEAINGTGTAVKREHARRTAFIHEFHLVVNYEAMRNDIDCLTAQPWDWLVFDESHRLKGRHKVQVFKAAQKLANTTNGLVLVTGTPILNHPEELWATLHLIDPKRYRGFWPWAEKHFKTKFEKHRGRLTRKVGDLKPGHEKYLRQHLDGRLIQQPLSVLLPDLPPVTETTLHLSLSPAERKMHDDMLKKAWMEVPEGVVQAANAVAKNTRLRQLTSDWSVFGIDKPGTKIKAAVELIGDLAPEQVLVFTSFRQTADMVVRQLGPTAVAIHGGIDTKTRGQHLAQFQAGGARVIAATIRSLGEGVDGLQVARNVIFLDRDWTPARNEQAVFRLRRMGQLQAVNVYYLVADDTIDETVSDALSRKESVIEAVLGRRTL